MRFYVASGLDNADQVKSLAALLRLNGWEHTYDWTAHGSVDNETPSRKQEVCLAETLGVSSADHVIVLLPGGRGTFTEFGMALAWDKKITVFAPSLKYLKPDGQGLVFFEYPNVKIYVGLTQEEMVSVLIDRPVALQTNQGGKP